MEDGLTSSIPLSSRMAPSTSENTPVPRIHSLVRPPLRTEGARSAGGDIRGGDEGGKGEILERGMREGRDEGGR